MIDKNLSEDKITKFDEMVYQILIKYKDVMPKRPDKLVAIYYTNTIETAKDLLKCICG